MCRCHSFDLLQADPCLPWHEPPSTSDWLVRAVARAMATTGHRDRGRLSFALAASMANGTQMIFHMHMFFVLHAVMQKSSTDAERVSCQLAQKTQDTDLLQDGSIVRA